jgi:diacylglycerol kinase family enzyme
MLFLNTSSVGAYVTFVHTRERLERLLGYWGATVLAAIRILARPRTFHLTMEVNGVEQEYHTPIVFIGVGERELRPPRLGARVAGGKPGLHVIVVRSRSRARMLALALAAAAKGVRAVARTPAFDGYIVERLRIEAGPRNPLHKIAVDGEIIAASPPLEYRLRRGALTVVVPDPAHADV